MEPEYESFEVSIDETDWDELCYRCHIHCKYCGDHPPLEDIHIFIETGTCSDCLDMERRFRAE